MIGKILWVLSFLMLAFSLPGVLHAKDDLIAQTGSVEFNEVTAMFSDNLVPKETLLRDLLLAIAIDHTASNAPDQVKLIGIPYILDKGIKYWARQLAKTPAPLDAIINNALFLLFSKERNKKSQSAALKLMKMAAHLNYWPAKYYIAEKNLEHHLSADYAGTPEAITDRHLKNIARTTMRYYTDCAKRGFAPCQYRIGTWLITNNNQAKDGIKALQSAIQISSDDFRYQDMFDIRRAHAAFIISETNHL